MSDITGLKKRERRRQPVVKPRLVGGSYQPLSQAEMEKIHHAVLDVMEKIGFATPTPSLIEYVTKAGGWINDEGRLCYPRALVEDVQKRRKSMHISRRDFLRYCGISAAALGLNGTDLMKLGELLASTSGPQVLWLVGSSCTGCSVSFLNYISTATPTSAADILVNKINLTYHPSLMATAGQDAAAIAEKAAVSGGHVLVVEGGVPTAFGGGACLAWTYKGSDVTFQQAVTKLAAKASNILCIGNCSAYGGISAAYRSLSWASW